LLLLQLYDDDEEEGLFKGVASASHNALETSHINRDLPSLPSFHDDSDDDLIL